MFYNPIYRIPDFDQIPVDELPRGRRRKPTLARDVDFVSGAGSWLDDDLEVSGWPEFIDQSRIQSAHVRWEPEDCEEDDPAGGDIVDEPHDSREEDGA